MFSVTRYHDFSAGHRVVGHESKCKLLHGHNYRVYFVCTGDYSHVDPNTELDGVGRVVDFGVIKSTLCQWLEDNWDHKMLIWDLDPIRFQLFASCPEVASSIHVVPFNPTAEGMAHYLVKEVGPSLLSGSGVVLDTVKVEETRKCSATYTRVI